MQHKIENRVFFFVLEIILYSIKIYWDTIFFILQFYLY